MFGNIGSDSSRFGIYRGNGLSAVLVGQSNVIPANLYSTTYTKPSFTAVSGQSLEFNKGEKIVIAYAIAGTTTRIRSISTPNNSNLIGWYNTTDSVAGGFPNNPRTAAGATTSMFCCRLIDYFFYPYD